MKTFKISEIIPALKNIADVDTNYKNSERETFLRFCANYKLCTDHKANKKMFQELFIAEHIGNMSVKNNMSFTKEMKPSSQPCVYVAMHLGAYKVLPKLIFANNINICIPVTNDIWEKQERTYIEEGKQINSKTKVEIINIETRQGLFKLIKHIKSGFSVFMFLDGNSGIGGMRRDDDKLLDYIFMKRKIKIRKGVDFFYCKMKMPVIPVVSYLSFDKMNITTSIEVLYNHTYKYTGENGMSIANDLWDLFVSYIEKYPSQWEGWCYIDAFYKYKESKETDGMTNKNCLRFNKDRYEFLIIGNMNYLYDSINNTKIKLSNGLFRYFKYLSETGYRVSRQEFLDCLQKENLIHDIIKFQILK